jgi:hypothetical protein
MRRSRASLLTSAVALLGAFVSALANHPVVVIVWLAIAAVWLVIGAFQWKREGSGGPSASVTSGTLVRRFFRILFWT